KPHPLTIGRLPQRCSETFAGCRVLLTPGARIPKQTAQSNRVKLMKTMIRYPLAIAILAVGVNLNHLAGPPSGQVDFGKFNLSGNDGEFVEVQIKSNLLSLAARLVEKQEPEAAKLVRSVELIRVNVIGLTDANRAETVKHVRQIRHDLE